MLEFLQSHFSKGEALANLRVYVAAISAEHVPMGGVSVGHQPLVSHFMQGLRPLRPFRLAQVPLWDLSIVLEGLSDHPFEPFTFAPGDAAQVVSAQWRGSEQLFVCFGVKSRGSAVTKQKMSHWIVEAISLGYEACSLTSPLGICANSFPGLPTI